MADKDEIFIHKVLYNQKLDDIIKLYYGDLTQPQLCSMRKHVSYGNQTHSNLHVRPGGDFVGSEPFCNEILILPAENILEKYNFYASYSRLEAFSDHHMNIENTYRSTELKIGFAERSHIQRFQEKIDPLFAIAFCQVSDGICNILSQKDHYKESLKDYTTDYFKEAGARIAEHSAELYSSVNALEGMLFKYSTSNEKGIRQTLKREIIKEHKKVSELMPHVVDKVVKKYAKTTQYNSLHSSTRAMKISDQFAKHGGARPVVLKKSFDRYLKFVKYGKYAPDLGTVIDFVDANYSAYKDYNTKSDWQKTLVTKDSAVLGFIIGTEVALLLFPPTSVPLLICAAISVTGATIASNLTERIANWGYEKWLQ